MQLICAKHSGTTELYQCDVIATMLFDKPNRSMMLCFGHGSCLCVYIVTCTQADLLLALQTGLSACAVCLTSGQPCSEGDIPELYFFPHPIRLTFSAKCNTISSF